MLEGMQLKTLNKSLQHPHLAPKAVKKPNKTMLKERELLTISGTAPDKDYAEDLLKKVSKWKLQNQQMGRERYLLKK